MRAILIGLCALFALYTVLVYKGPDHVGTEPPDARVLAGMQQWQEQNCQSCHQFYGLGGYMGPDLTNVTARRSEQLIRTFIRYGTGRMPAHDLTETEIDELVVSLRWVNASGSSQVPDSAVHWTGTYILER